MTGDELDRAIAFLLEQQARFEAVQERDHAALMTLRDVVASNTALIQSLGETQLAMGKAQLAMGVSLQEMQRAEARTDERLNALIVMFEKFINRNGNGHAPGSS